MNNKTRILVVILIIIVILCGAIIAYKFYRDKVTLRKSIMLKASRKAKRISKKIKPTAYDAKQMLSYLGWVKCTNVYNMYLKWIKPFISFQELKRIVSKHDK